MNSLCRVGSVIAAIAFAFVAHGASGEPLAPLAPLKPPKAEQVELGKLLFFDPRLSGDAAISCATCHDPKKGWGDAKALSTGYPGSEHFRNSQTILNAAYYKRNYWDGRMDGRDLATLVRDHLTEAHFMQVDGRLFTERLKQVPEYEELFKKAFGGEPSFGRTLNAIVAFVQTVTSRNAPFDRHLKGETAALSSVSQEGMKLFLGKAGCIQCHDGALLSDQKFHSLGVPENPAVYAEPLRHITFRRFTKTLGVPNYDNLREDVGLYAVTKDPHDRGRFRTPSLREVSLTAPYMHNGVFPALEAVVDFYDQGGGTHPNKSPLLKPLGLTDGEKRAVVEFLRSLSGDLVLVEPPGLPEYRLRTLGKN